MQTFKNSFLNQNKINDYLYFSYSKRSNKSLNQSLDWKARLFLLYTSLLFWILSINDSQNPIYYTSRLVSVCSFFNYIFYNDETRGIVGQIDAIIVRFAGAHFLCYLTVDLWNDLKKNDEIVLIINQNEGANQYCFEIDALRIYYKYVNILFALSVGPIYYYRKHPNLQLLVHLSALISLSMYSFRNSLFGF
jgi:hypothetical protein